MLKATAAATVAGLLLAGGPPVQADSLLTGAIRDRTGVAVGGARVTAFDAAGRPVGSDVAQADGTFAIAALVAPAEVVVGCDYCRAERRSVDPAEPVVIVIERYSAVTAAGPSPADVRALPYRSAADIASLRPFTVVSDGRISDRGLDFEGATLVEGLPFYSAADGSTYANLVPAHATASVTALPPLAAPVYGGYATAGVYDVRLHDSDLSTGRLDTGDASDAGLHVGGAGVAAGYAASADAGDDRQVVNAEGSATVGGGRLSLTAVDLTDLTERAAGGGLAYATESRRFSTFAAASATDSGDASLVSVSAGVRDRGPLGLSFGARAERATSSSPSNSGTQFDGAVYASAGLQMGANSLAAVAAFDRGSNGGIVNGSPAAAVVGSLADDVQLSARWSAHSGIVSNLRVPTLAEATGVAPVVIGGDRSLLFEQSVTYEDLRRLRLTGLVYAQHASGSADSATNGVGIDAAWQVAPQLLVRGWLLRANQTLLPVVDPNAPYSSLAPGASAGALTRQLLWLTYGTSVRFDAVLRGNGLEGDVRIPFGSVYAFALGSAMENGRRVATFGLTLR